VFAVQLHAADASPKKAPEIKLTDEPKGGHSVATDECFIILDNVDYREVVDRPARALFFQNKIKPEVDRDNQKIELAFPEHGTQIAYAFQPGPPIMPLGRTNDDKYYLLNVEELKNLPVSCHTECKHEPEVFQGPDWARQLYWSCKEPWKGDCVNQVPDPKHPCEKGDPLTHDCDAYVAERTPRDGVCEISIPDDAAWGAAAKGRVKVIVFVKGGDRMWAQEGHPYCPCRLDKSESVEDFHQRFNADLSGKVALDKQAPIHQNFVGVIKSYKTANELDGDKSEVWYMRPAR